MQCTFFSNPLDFRCFRFFSFVHLSFLLSGHVRTRVDTLPRVLVGISASIPQDVPILSMYPPAFSVGNKLDYSQLAAALARSQYPNIWYNLYADMASVMIQPGRLVLNGVPPVKFVIDQGWLSGLGVI